MTVNSSYAVKHPSLAVGLEPPSHCSAPSFHSVPRSFIPANPRPLSLSTTPPADSIAAYSYQAFAAVMLHFGEVMRH